MKQWQLTNASSSQQYRMGHNSIHEDMRNGTRALTNNRKISFCMQMPLLKWMHIAHHRHSILFKIPPGIISFDLKYPRPLNITSWQNDLLVFRSQMMNAMQHSNDELQSISHRRKCCLRLEIFRLNMASHEKSWIFLQNAHDDDYGELILVFLRFFAKEVKQNSTSQLNFWIRNRPIMARYLSSAIHSLLL